MTLKENQIRGIGLFLTSIGALIIGYSLLKDINSVTNIFFTGVFIITGIILVFNTRMTRKKLFYVLGIIVAVVVLVEGVFFLIDGRLRLPIMEYNTDGVIRSNDLNDKPINTSSSTPFFPVANKPSESVMTALLKGELTLENGCLRVNNNYNNYLLVWPYGFSLSTDKDGVIQVFDDAGRAVVRVGDRVRFGGGADETPDGDVAKYYSAQLPSDRCSGPYWIVGEVIADNESNN